MMPPMRGTDANAAAMFEGKPVEVGCVVGLGGGDDGGGAEGSTGSAMAYIHKLANELSSQLSNGAARFALSRIGQSQYYPGRNPTISIGDHP